MVLMQLKKLKLNLVEFFLLREFAEIFFNLVTKKLKIGAQNMTPFFTAIIELNFQVLNLLNGINKIIAINT